MGLPYLTLTIVCLLSATLSMALLGDHEHEEEFVCSHNYKMLRCQRENFNRTILHNFRTSFNWSHSPQSVHRIACMCNKIAAEKGYPYFGLSFYGLCNGFHEIAKTAEEGVCYDGNLDVCDTKIDRECDGGPLYEALYKTGKEKNAAYVTHNKNQRLTVIKPAETTCPSGYRFRKLACQKEDFARLILFNDRHTIEWQNFENWLRRMVCKCRAYAKANKFEYFSISFWGLCGGLDKHGHKLTTKPSDCKRSLTGNMTQDTCDLDKTDEPCAGKGFADVVYDTETHPCDTKEKGGCQQRCMRNEDDFYCACYDGFKMVKENHKHVCKPFTGECAENGIGYVDHDIKHFTNVASWQECSAKCSATQGCHAWTWTSPTSTDVTHRKWCFVKRSDSGRKQIQGKISGPLGCNEDSGANTVSLATTNNKKDNLIRIFRELPEIYTVSFSLMLDRTLLGWHSVLHFTVGGDKKNFGDRLPGVFVNEDTLEISSSVNSPNNVIIYKHFPLKKWVNIRVMFSKLGTEYWYIVYVGGKQVKRIRNMTPRAYSNVKVYYGDKWYPPFKGMIRNLKVIVHK